MIAEGSAVPGKKEEDLDAKKSTEGGISKKSLEESFERVKEIREGLIEQGGKEGMGYSRKGGGVSREKRTTRIYQICSKK